MPTQPTEEEKKIICTLLGKLYISTASSEEKIRDVYADVCDQVENPALSDATSRNAMYKIHVSLGKIVNALDSAAASAPGAGLSVAGGGRRSMSRSASMGIEDRTAVADGDRTAILLNDEETIKEEDEEDGTMGQVTVDGGDDDTVVMRRGKTPAGRGVDDSLVDDLLTDDGEDDASVV